VVDVELLYKRHKHATILPVNVDINFVMVVVVDGLEMVTIVLLQEIIKYLLSTALQQIHNLNQL